MKENIKLKIIKESIKVLILASILSSIGGMGLESIKDKLVIFIPIIIMIPALNSMIGNLGIVIVSKFSTLLSLRKIKRPLLKSHFIRHIIKEIIPIAIFSAFYITILSYIFSIFRGFNANITNFMYTFFIATFTTFFLIIIILFVAILGSLYVYHKKGNPDDLLIPITTSIADLGTMLLVTFLVTLII